MHSKLILIMFVVSGLWASSGVLLELEPAIGNSPSEYRVVKSIPGSSKPHTFLKSSRDIWQANYEIQYDNGNWVYYCPRNMTDTMVVRFVSPARCSLVAFTWMSYCDVTGTTGQPVNVFVTDLNPSVDYTTYPGYYESDSFTPNPLGPRLWSGVSTCPPSGVWDTVNIPATYIDPATNAFFCCWNPGYDQEAMLAGNPSYSGNPIDCHSYRCNYSENRWYAYYYTSVPDMLTLGIRAYVYAYFEPVLLVEPEGLPYSYDTSERTVNVLCSFLCAMGDSVEKIILYYSVNGGVEDTVMSTIPIARNVWEELWQLEIPGVSAGDTVDYYVFGESFGDLVDTSNTYTYEILEGTPNHFLYVDNDHNPAIALPDHYTGIIDVWNYEEYGAPDSSVLCFYANGIGDTSKTIVWRDCRCTALGKGADYGLGWVDDRFGSVSLLHSDSSWIKMLLDNGGNFWLSDQDQGRGFGFGYGHKVIPPGHWIREYLGIKGMWDDNDSLAQSSVTAYGNPADPVIGDLFSGVGYQNSGEIFIAPYKATMGNYNKAWVGSFDSLMIGAVINMFDENNFTISYRYETSTGGKVYNDFYPFDYIADPNNDTIIDEVAVDSLVEDVLGWFNIESGISDRTLEPGKVVKLLPVGIVTNEAIIKFSLPGRTTISLDIYDNTGRLVNNLVNGKVSAGLNTIRWDGKDSYGNRTASGVYFYRLNAGEKTLTNKMVVIK